MYITLKKNNDNSYIILLNNYFIIYTGISLRLVLIAYTMRIPLQSPCELHCFLSLSEGERSG